MNEFHEDMNAHDKAVNETRNNKKIFGVAQVRDLLNQVHNEKITFSRFVEILNELATKNLLV